MDHLGTSAICPSSIGAAVAKGAQWLAALFPIQQYPSKSNGYAGGTGGVVELYQ